MKKINQKQNDVTMNAVNNVLNITNKDANITFTTFTSTLLSHLIFV